ncbi:DUF4998 domain-containing protein [Pedobacter frigoris]|uniref:DUF4998 domain-containing protein n=1 Tax=Pedobacter frigoris TaxID=2571272 RepID=UPI00293134FD|nr:DUF4998 domain-containing protein [Pedobacter frigoris]
MKLKLIAGFLLLIIIASCNKEGYNYDNYLKGKEVTYTGRVSNFLANPGNKRVQLRWTPSSDRSVSKYVVYYNNKRDSVVVPAKNEATSDTIKVIIPNLEEYIQDFTLFTVDAAGSRSVGQTLTAVKVYGPLYVSSLRNRRFTTSSLSATNLTMNFAENTDTINVTTKLTYNDATGSTVDMFLHPESLKVVLPNWKAGETVLVRSTFKPVKNSVDVFPVGYTDNIKIN